MEKRSRGNGRLCDAGRVRIILAGVPLVIAQMAGAAESADVCRWLGRRLGWPNCYFVQERVAGIYILYCVRNTLL